MTPSKPRPQRVPFEEGVSLLAQPNRTRDNATLYNHLAAPHDRRARLNHPVAGKLIVKAVMERWLVCRGPDSRHSQPKRATSRRGNGLCRWTSSSSSILPLQGILETRHGHELVLRKEARTRNTKTLYSRRHLIIRNLPYVLVIETLKVCTRLQPNVIWMKISSRHLRILLLGLVLLPLLLCQKMSISKYYG
jgi:hypothetical protein